MTVGNIWTPARNHLYPKQVRLANKSILLICQRLRDQRKQLDLDPSFGSLPQEVVTLICQFVAGKTVTVAVLGLNTAADGCYKFDLFDFNGVTLSPSADQQSNRSNISVPTQFRIHFALKHGATVYLAGTHRTGMVCVLEYSWNNVSANVYKSKFHPGPSSVGDPIYVCRGSIWDRVYARFDLAAKEWFRVPTMKTTQPNWAAWTAVGDHIYVIGGYNSRGITGQVVRYDSTMGTWKTMASMNHRRARHSAACLGDYIYVCGGRCSGAEILKCERYSILQDNWESIADMNCERSEFGLLVADGKLIAIGGSSKDEEGFVFDETYDPDMNIWSVARKYDNIPNSNVAFCIDG